MFEREDWQLYRGLSTLGQKAGVPLRHLAALTLKELTDNALDAGAKANIHRTPEGWYVVEDDGPGIPGTGADIARLFSIRRPLASSKLIRKPSRGALGNGLRVVAGVVLASGGELWVDTRGSRHHLTPMDDGSTHVTTVPGLQAQGTCVAIKFGDTLPVTEGVMEWSKLAAALGELGTLYNGKTSAWWYDSESFFDLMQAAGAKSVGAVLTHFKEFKANTVGQGSQAVIGSEVSRDFANMLLSDLRLKSTPPAVKVIGKLGDTLSGYAYASASEMIETGTESFHPSKIPALVEAYVKVAAEGATDSITVLVNRTPITGSVSTQRQKAHELAIIGCGLKHLFDVGRKNVSIVLNVTIPYMPITTDGKEPDLYRIIVSVGAALESAAKKAKRAHTKAQGPELTMRDVIRGNLKAGMDKASGDNKYRYSLRQLFYAIRPYALELLGKEPDYNYFAQVVTDVEATLGYDLPGLYRDARGVLYHPHTGEEIPLGTLNVERYQRPEWSFNKVLYCEKEGLQTLLKEVGWPERNDCALLSSKGFASRAARDVLDMIGDTQEEIYFFCIHDADASGTLIHQALSEATKARGARKVHVINLGLDPWEALDMGLQVETFRTDSATTAKRGVRRLPVAEYVPQEWADWLQSQRVELNAMTSPQFLDWLDAKFETYTKKVVPPKRVLSSKLDVEVHSALSSKLAAKLLQESGFEGKLSALVDAFKRQGTTVNLDTLVRTTLDAEPEKRWDAPVAVVAGEVADKLVGG